jgi:hypothetical protein
VLDNLTTTNQSLCRARPLPSVGRSAIQDAIFSDRGVDKIAIKQKRSSEQTVSCLYWPSLYPPAPAL